MKKILFGFILSVVILAISFGGLLAGKSATSWLLTVLDFESRRREAESAARLNPFSFSFEASDDVKIFQARKVGIAISEKIASLGKRSLEVEFPPRHDYPGIWFELYGKQMLNWNGIKEFAFDVFNSMPLDASLVVQIRSGQEYPKKEYKATFSLKPEQWTHVVIAVDDLAQSIDLTTVSHMTIFMSNQATTYRLYFDNMRAVR